MNNRLIRCICLTTFLFCIVKGSSQDLQYLNNQLNFHYNKGDYINAVLYGEKVLKKIETDFGKNSTNYSTILNNLAFLHKITGQYERALILYLEALSVSEKIHGKKHLDYIDKLSNLSMLYKSMGLYNDALKASIEVLEISEKVLTSENPDYGRYLNNLASIYDDIGQYEKSLSLYLKTMEIEEKNIGKEHSNYGRLLNNIALLHSKMGKYDKARPLLLESLQTIENTVGKDHPSYGNCLNNLASLYEDMGQHDKALKLYFEALDNTEKYLSSNHPNYWMIKNNIAGIYYRFEHYDEALNLYLESLEKIEKVLGKENSDYGLILNNISDLYIRIGQFDKALPLCFEALENTKKALGIDHADYGIRLNNLAGLYKRMGQYEKALPLFLEALIIIEKALGKDHSEYGSRLNNLAALYESTGHYDKAFSNYTETHRNMLSNIQRNYAFLTEKEKEQYNRTLFNKFTAFHGFTYHARHQVPEAVEQDFLIHLATSGILLNSAVDMRKLIYEHNDEALIDLLNQWLATNQRLDLAVSLSQEERIQRGLDIPTIRKEAEDLERTLVQKSSALAELPEYTLGKEQVANALQVGEAAVQFNSFTYRNLQKWTDSVLYVAYIVLPNGALHYVPLFEEAALEPLLSVFASGNKANTSEVHTHLQQMYQLIWEPLLPYLEGIETIYYAPSGLLSKVPFSALPINDQQRLSEVYDLYALLSVRDLPKLKQQAEPISASKTLALFGGAYFDSQAPSDSEEDSDYMYDFLMNKPLSSLVSDAYRSGWAYLKGTLQEVTGIYQVAQKVGIPTMLFTGADAEEKQLKQVIGEKQPAYLHIATHGYYIPPPQQQPKDNLLRIGNEKELAAQQDDPLLRSGLLLSGANAKWVHKKNIDSDNDGILTALEISRLPLNQTELVVLSACETGLGDITHSEGVMGLQRAFRMAGAKRMIVSLWEVPDQATAEMMELFYSKLFTSNLSYHEAFKQAQETLKTKYPNDPIKWAGFVLIR